VLRQDAQLDSAAPGVGRLDPAAVIVRALLENDFGVHGRFGLDGACHEGAQLRHAEVVAGEHGGGESAEETAVVVRHDAED
jgi:hypothetical protein